MTSVTLGRATTTIHGNPIWTQAEGGRSIAIAHDSYQATITEQAMSTSLLDYSARALLTSIGVTLLFDGTIQTKSTSPILMAEDGTFLSGSMRITAVGKPAVLDVSITDDAATVTLDADGNGTIDTTHTLTREAIEALF